MFIIYFMSFKFNISKEVNFMNMCSWKVVNKNVCFYIVYNIGSFYKRVYYKFVLNLKFF